jgi:hypothetical protein
MNKFYNLTPNGHLDKDHIVCILKNAGDYEAYSFVKDDEHTAFAVLDSAIQDDHAELVWNNNHSFFERFIDRWTNQLKPFAFN